MKTILAALLAVAALGGCVVVPAEPVSGVYVAPHGHGHHHHHGHRHRHHRHWR